MGAVFPFFLIINTVFILLSVPPSPTYHVYLCLDFMDFFSAFMHAIIAKSFIELFTILVRHETGNDQDYLRKIPRVVVQKSALL
jgi:hypothetical protein